jgi:hypothetical protein
MRVSGAENIHSLYYYSVATTKELAFLSSHLPKLTTCAISLSNNATIKLFNTKEL